MSWKRWVLITTAIGVIGVSGVVALNRTVARSYLPHAERITLLTRMRELRMAAEFWRDEHPGAACPTAEELKRARMLDAATPLDDWWGQPLRIVCNGEKTTVLSLGADRREGTADDRLEAE